MAQRIELFRGWGLEASAILNGRGRFDPVLSVSRIDEPPPTTKVPVEVELPAALLSGFETDESALRYALDFGKRIVAGAIDHPPVTTHVSFIDQGFTVELLVMEEGGQFNWSGLILGADHAPSGVAVETGPNTGRFESAGEAVEYAKFCARAQILQLLIERKRAAPSMWTASGYR